MSTVSKELAMAVLELDVPDNVKEMARMVLREEAQPQWSPGFMAPSGPFLPEHLGNMRPFHIEGYKPDALPKPSTHEEPDGES